MWTTIILIKRFIVHTSGCQARLSPNCKAYSPNVPYPAPDSQALWLAAPIRKYSVDQIIGKSTTGGVQEGFSSFGYHVATSGADKTPITCPKARGAPIEAPKVRREPMRRPPEEEGEALGSLEAERIKGRSPREKIIAKYSFQDKT